MRSEDSLFEGGPLDGRVLPVLTGINGRPPKRYEVPVPDDGGSPGTVHVYLLQQVPFTSRLGIPRGWRYVYEPQSPSSGGGRDD